MLFRMLLMDRQLTRNFIALLQNWPDCRSLIRNTADKIQIQEKMNTKYKTQLEFGMYPQSMPTEWTHVRTVRAWQSVRLDL